MHFCQNAIVKTLRAVKHVSKWDSSATPMYSVYTACIPSLHRYGPPLLRSTQSVTETYDDRKKKDIIQISIRPTVATLPLA